MKCINYFCTTLLLFLENYHQLIREVVLDRFVNRSCVSSKHTTQKLQSSLNWLTFPYNDGWYDYSTTAAALFLRNMQLFNNSFPAFSLKGRLEFLLASMRIISICIKELHILYNFSNKGQWVNRPINNFLAAVSSSEKWCNKG